MPVSAPFIRALREFVGYFMISSQGASAPSSAHLGLFIVGGILGAVVLGGLLQIVRALWSYEAQSWRR